MLRHLAHASELLAHTDCWASVLPPFAADSGSKHELKPLKNSAGGFWLDGPDRSQHVDDLACTDVGHRHVANLGKHIGSHRVFPLLSVLGVRQRLSLRHPASIERLLESYADLCPGGWRRHA